MTQHDPEIILKYGVYGLLFITMSLVIPSLFLLIYRLNAANRISEAEQRKEFAAALKEKRDSFTHALENTTEHCKEEMIRVTEAFREAQTAADKRMDRLVDALSSRLVKEV